MLFLKICMPKLSLARRSSSSYADSKLRRMPYTQYTPFKSHPPGEPRPASCPLKIRGIKAIFYRRDALPLTHPTASKH